MNPKLLIASALLLASASLSAVEHVRGTLIKAGAGFAVKTANNVYQIETSNKIAASLPSLESPSFVVQSNGEKYAFEFKGEIRGDVFHLNQTPTQVAGTRAETGFLRYEDGVYTINDKLVRFGYTKELNGYQFDEISKRFFVDKEVFAEGRMEDGKFVVNALTPVGLFEATPSGPAPQAIQSKIDQMGVWDFMFLEMIKNKHSQSKEPFRITLAEDGKQAVAPGESALIVTLSGRQGDSFGSVNGHFVAGLGEVRDDMTLRAEVSNAYVTNGKDILSGNTSLTSYYSHFVQGQNNYRPTYTLIAYGVDKKKLKQFRDALEASHIKFRTNDLDITPQFNCTTETVKALSDAGIRGNYKKYDNYLKNLLTLPLALPFVGETLQTLRYGLKNDASLFQPRPAYNSFLGAFLNSSFRERHGVKRVDFVFYPQIPSKRPTGGMALGRLFKVNDFKKLYDRYEVNPKTKLSPEELRPILKKRLQSIPFGYLY